MADKGARKPGAKRSACLPNASLLKQPVAVPTSTREVGGLPQVGSEMERAVAPAVFPVDLAFRAQLAVAGNRTLRVAPRLARLVLSERSRELGVNESEVLRCLVTARRLVRHGWCQRVPWCDDAGKTNPADCGELTHFSLVGAIKSATEDALVSHYTLKFLADVLGAWNLNDWNDNPVRSKAHVVRVLDEAIVQAGGVRRNGGGWAVGVH